MPISFPASFTIGTPEILYSRIRSSASWRMAVGGNVIGSTIMPDSLRLTFRTISACISSVMFLCSTPMPPALAIAIAILVSETVSIALEISGVLRRIFRVSCVSRLTKSGVISEYAGSSSTSSKVKPSSANLLDGLKAVISASIPFLEPVTEINL